MPGRPAAAAGAGGFEGAGFEGAGFEGAGFEGAPPALAIVAGRPTPQETAAVVVVLSALARPARAPDGGAGAAGRSQWAARSRLLRGPVTAGPDAWRGSALPR